MLFCLILKKADTPRHFFAILRQKASAGHALASDRILIGFQKSGTRHAR